MSSLGFLYNIYETNKSPKEEPWSITVDKEKRREYTKKYYQEHKAAHREERREYMKRWHQEHDKEAREEREAYKRRLLETNPKRRAQAAYLAVKAALKTGELTKPKKCSACGSSAPLHGHHEDYDKPLEVEWLCAKCHRKRR